MYPTVVIVLVETQRSMADVCEINPSNPSGKLRGPVASEVRPASLGYLSSFAVGRTHGTTYGGAKPQHSRVLHSQGEQEPG